VNSKEGIKIKMKKLLKSKKALSPVIASIILIAVTVAVSIAVAAWMGALTFSFTKTEQLSITGYTTWNSTVATLTVVNTGASSLTISVVKLDSAIVTGVKVNGTTLGGTTSTLAKGQNAVVTIPGTYVSGTQYNFELDTKAGNTYPYTVTKP
jgi:flagellin-like protein